VIYPVDRVIHPLNNRVLYGNYKAPTPRVKNKVCYMSQDFGNFKLGCRFTRGIWRFNWHLVWTFQLQAWFGKHVSFKHVCYKHTTVLVWTQLKPAFQGDSLSCHYFHFYIANSVYRSAAPVQRIGMKLLCITPPSSVLNLRLRRLSFPSLVRQKN